TSAKVFNDHFRIERFDTSHSDVEDRYIAIGEINGSTFIVFVSYTERKEVIRLISARKATASERREYYDSKERN
ncbi:MAG: BrnT family toxin, partial [Firmicutes bacterium]|nr:BrnT family toxin [Bacillota bacterium]